MIDVIVLLVAAGMIILSTLLHLEAISLLGRFSKTNVRVRLLLFVPGLLVAHILEIQLFAIAYMILCSFSEFGSVANVSTVLDYVYFSGVVYTTLGFGDVFPIGPIRSLVWIESVVGLAMIAWSATFMYSQIDSSTP